jgi:hypothetical protein
MTATLGSTLGMDTVAGRQAGEQLAHGSAQIAELAQRLDMVVMALEWAGMDADRYRSDWRDQQRPTLDATARLLSEVAALIRGEADAQDQASDSGGSVAAVGSVAPPRAWGCRRRPAGTTSPSGSADRPPRRSDRPAQPSGNHPSPACCLTTSVT